MKGCGGERGMKGCGGERGMKGCGGERGMKGCGGGGKDSSLLSAIGSAWTGVNALDSCTKACACSVVDTTLTLTREEVAEPRGALLVAQTLALVSFWGSALATTLDALEADTADRVSESAGAPVWAHVEAVTGAEIRRCHRRGKRCTGALGFR